MSRSRPPLMALELGGELFTKNKPLFRPSVPVVSEDNPERPYQPSLRMQVFVKALLSYEARGKTSVAEKMTGVTRRYFYNLWHREPKFRIWFEQVRADYFKVNAVKVDTALMAQCSKGDVSAMKIFYEIDGKISNKTINNSSIHADKVQINIIRFDEGENGRIENTGAGVLRHDTQTPVSCPA